MLGTTRRLERTNGTLDDFLVDHFGASDDFLKVPKIKVQLQVNVKRSLNGLGIVLRSCGCRLLTKLRGTMGTITPATATSGDLSRATSGLGRRLEKLLQVPSSPQKASFDLHIYIYIYICIVLCFPRTFGCELVKSSAQD